MGKASANKKVARAAGTGGGRASRRRVPWTYYSVIAAVVVLGLALTVTSRDRRLSQINNAGSGLPTVGTVWNEGFAVDICGKFVPAIKTSRDPYGLTTSGDGIIHIHPTVKAAAGKNATLGKFASSIGMKLNAAELQVPGGKLYVDGDTCGGKASHIYVQKFAYTGDTIGQLQTVSPDKIALEDQSLLTIAFLPSSDKKAIPVPPSYVITNLKKLAAQSQTSTTTVAPAVSVPTTANAPAATTPTGSTTVPATSTTRPSTSPTT